MTVVNYNGRIYRVSPGGLVWSGFQRPSQPELGYVWKRMGRGSKLSRSILEAAGLAEPEKPSSTRLTKRRLYAMV